MSLRTADLVDQDSPVVEEPFHGGSPVADADRFGMAFRQHVITVDPCHGTAGFLHPLGQVAEHDLLGDGIHRRASHKLQRSFPVQVQMFQGDS